MSPRGVGAAAQAADDVERGVGGGGAQPFDEVFGDGHGVAHQVSAGVLSALGDGLENELFLFRPHALEAAQGAARGRLFEGVERGDAELAVDQRDGLGADALEAEQFKDRRRELAEQLLVVGGGSGRGNLADACGEVPADAGEVQQVGVGHVGDGFGTVGDDLGAGADTRGCGTGFPP